MSARPKTGLADDSGKAKGSLSQMISAFARWGSVGRMKKISKMNIIMNRLITVRDILIPPNASFARQVRIRSNVWIDRALTQSDNDAGSWNWRNRFCCWCFHGIFHGENWILCNSNQKGSRSTRFSIERTRGAYKIAA